jgi:hypothetical protein
LVDREAAKVPFQSIALLFLLLFYTYKKTHQITRRGAAQQRI